MSEPILSTSSRFTRLGVTVELNVPSYRVAQAENGRDASIAT